ncbi:sulfite exporter TauE/SafE family protein [Patescibacteria group bacterium]|nr:sulfite exporter TauE/SafE family protein [Patescibacteria group bacterium]
MSQVSIAFAFVAGIVSFAAPCILPIIPGLIAYLGGTTVEKAKSIRLAVFLNSVFFVLGFSVIFSALGVLLNSILESVAYDVQIWLGRIGGAIIIFFGLYLLGLLKIPWLEKEHKLPVKTKYKSRYATSFVFGAAFAVGWTPCVGAALGAILGLAATQPGNAFFLLLAYSIGLGIPFLLIGLFTAQAKKIIDRYAKYATWVNRIFGLLLIALGILVFTNRLALIANFELLNRLLLQ